MPCYDAQLAVRMPGLTQKGKQPLKFIGKARDIHKRYQGTPTGALLLPCRQCIGCRLEKSRQWATRLMHEVNFHRGAIFLTLTYDEEMVPKDRSLKKDHLQTFFKDLRQRMNYHGKEKIKYFSCGEYGDLTERPHYHCALYGPFSVHGEDAGREPAEPARSGDPQFTHSDVSACWPHGLHRFSDLTFESAAYVARYCLKKISGAPATTHYGERAPEFQSSSNGLGRLHFETWSGDVYPSDHVVIPGRGEFLPPPYYDRLLEKADPALYEKVKKKRAEAHEKMTESQWWDHVNRRRTEGEVRTLVTKATLIRGIE